jgi:hypothetical protein
VPIRFGTVSGNDVEILLTGIESALAVQTGDLLYAIDRQQSRILHRTGRFLDYNEQPFKPYNETRPYYWYPYGKSQALKEHEMKRVHRLAKQVGDGMVTRGGGIRYDSYAAFKRALGRLGVDLLGPAAPHMLQGFQIFVNGVRFDFHDRGDYDAYVAPATKVILGIYGNKGDIAVAHNEGGGRMPQREFFRISSSDRDDIFNDIIGRLKKRLEAVNG